MPIAQRLSLRPASLNLPIFVLAYLLSPKQCTIMFATTGRYQGKVSIAGRVLARRWIFRGYEVEAHVALATDFAAVCPAPSQSGALQNIAHPMTREKRGFDLAQNAT
jgi:hypothetical protein